MLPLSLSLCGLEMKLCWSSITNHLMDVTILQTLIISAIVSFFAGKITLDNYMAGILLSIIFKDKKM